jgi:CheY-like chemotaxis protein
VVEIRLPVTARAAAAVPAEPSPAATAHTLRVLIVEDNVDAAEMLELAVASLGHHARIAHDGGTAVTTAIEFAPDVIFLDIGLPVMNGYAVAQTLRARPEFKHVHIAALTGWGQDEDRRKARDAGCDTHLTKPLSPTTLAELLSTIALRTVERPHDASPPRTRRTDAGGSL